MINKKIKEMLLDIIAEVDYDIGKDYDPELSEMTPEDIDFHLITLVNIVKKHFPLIGEPLE